MGNTTTNYKTVKISNADYAILISLQHFTFRKRKMSVSKKHILGWAIRKALQELVEYEKSN